ncbi:MAG TPA: GNAT family N-acetyltransferase [Candidatus Binataceae bacterium]|nr:GNAT family N-acetyltransferase [Candidatus Binataceae bacterium]
MTAMPDNSNRSTYPREIRVGDEMLTLRYMIAADRDAMVAFAQALPAHDLLFLRRDITRPDMVDLWLEDINRERITTILAEHAGVIVGYATVDRGDVTWSPHVAELRVMVASSMRRRGLGRVLTMEAFRIALDRGVEKMVAQMTTDQEGAIAVFETLGFRTEALLRNHVKDREGQKLDLLIMAHDVERFLAQMEAYGMAEALEG